MEQERGGHYSYALRYAWLTAVYDPVVRWTCRETRFKTELVRQARVSAGDQVLDLGCGTATLSLMMKKAHPGAVVTGLDGSDQILDIAREKTAVAGVDLSFTHALSYDMPYDDSQFDRVVSSFFFHHLETRDSVASLLPEYMGEAGFEQVTETRRVLTPLGSVSLYAATNPPLAA